jgi:hypothetical protein
VDFAVAAADDDALAHHLQDAVDLSLLAAHGLASIHSGLM